MWADGAAWYAMWQSCEVVEEKEGAMDTRGRCGGCHVMHLRPVQT